LVFQEGEWEEEEPTRKKPLFFLSLLSLSSFSLLFFFFSPGVPVEFCLGLQGGRGQGVARLLELAVRDEAGSCRHRRRWLLVVAVSVVAARLLAAPAGDSEALRLLSRLLCHGHAFVLFFRIYSSCCGLAAADVASAGGGAALERGSRSFFFRHMGGNVRRSSSSSSRSSRGSFVVRHVCCC
jgi:hypothetical protein